MTTQKPETTTSEEIANGMLDALKAQTHDTSIHKMLVATYFDGTEEPFIVHSWMVSRHLGLLNLRICPRDLPKVRRLSIPLANLKYFRIEDE